PSLSRTPLLPCHLTLFFSLLLPRPPSSTLFPYTTLFRSRPTDTMHCMTACAAKYWRCRMLGPRTGMKKAPKKPRLCIRHRQYLRSEEHTSELQSRFDLVCRLLLEKKKKKKRR